MSLTTQLRDGALGAWCAAALPGAPALIGQVQAAARGREPVRPVGNVDPDHWATIGGAFGQRLAFLISHEAPRAALLGAANAGLDPELVDAFTAHLAGCLTAHAPPGRLTATRDAEETLARGCWVLSGWEDAYRGKGLPSALARAHRDSCPLYGDPEIADACVQLLMLETPVHVVEELVKLAGRLHGSGALAELRGLADNPPPGTPLGVAGPVFVEHWADGDIVVGDTLIDVKTVITLRDRERIARWLYQLLPTRGSTKMTGTESATLACTSPATVYCSRGRWTSSRTPSLTSPGARRLLAGSSSTTPTTRCTSKVRCRSPSPGKQTRTA